MGQNFEIMANELDKKYSSGLLDFQDTSELDPLDTVIGQKRAIEAIDFGLNMKGSEYNIFVTGLEGTGKSTIVRKLLMAHAEKCNTSQDLCLVNNFEDAYCPVVLEMPAGSAVYFSQSMTQFIELLKTKIPNFFETSSFQAEQNNIHKAYSERQKETFAKVEQLAQANELTIVRTENGYQVVPVRDGQPMTDEAYQSMEPAVQETIGKHVSGVEKKTQSCPDRNR